MSNVALATTTYVAFSITAARKNAVAYVPTGLQSPKGLTTNSFRLAHYGSLADANQPGFSFNGPHHGRASL